MTDPACKMCDGTGFKDHASFCMEPCDHQQPQPLPDLLPCPNPTCGSTNVRFRSDTRGAQWISCAGCGLSTSDGGQDRQYALWNSLPRLDAQPSAWLYVSRRGDREVILNRNSEFAALLRELEYIETPLHAAATANGEGAHHG